MSFVTLEEVWEIFKYNSIEFTRNYFKVSRIVMDKYLNYYGLR